MSDTSINDFFSRQAHEARGPESERPARRKRKRSKVLRRIALASGISLVVLAGAIAGGGYLFVNHLASSVHRIGGITALTAADQPVMPAATRRSMTVLLTGAGTGQDPDSGSGLISLVHLNASGRAGAVVNLPADAVVRIPGHGRMELSDALKLGGPSLLVKTVEDLTNVRINNYSVINFAGVQSVVAALGGVDVDVPFTMSSEGITFPKGINHLSATDVLPYVRQADVSEIGREELQSGLIRAILDEIAHRRLFSHVDTDLRVLHAITHALSVDSSMSNSELESLALRLSYLKGRDGTFVTAPTTNGSPLSGGDGAVYLNKAISDQLWKAIRNDSVAAFARRYPSTVTPSAPE